MRRYHVLIDGEWIRPKRRKFREMCCDCGLTHDLDFRIVDGEIEFRATRNNRATSAARRRRKTGTAGAPGRFGSDHKPPKSRPLRSYARDGDDFPGA
jgi:hypothetical protein